MTPRTALRPRVTPLLSDGLLALALSALSVTLLSPFRALPAYAIPLALAHTAPLVLRRRAPLAAASASLVAAFGYISLGLPMVGLGPAALVWLYTIGALVTRPAAYVLLAASQAVVAVAIGVAGDGDLGTWAADAIALMVAFLLGESARRRRDLLALHRARADELEHTQAEVARRAVAEERLRIARELHDVVAHSMSVIAVQAGTGRLVVDTQPDRAREALTVIERTSRSAMDEMRRLLGVLRDGGESLDRAPAPGLDGVDALVARTVAAGVPVKVRVEGERRPLPAGLELTAYRIVQEALTNVARHAPGAATTVVLRYTERGIALSVRNAAGATPSAYDGSGLGLVGMSERAAVYGGTVAAGPTGDGGFQVAVELEAGP